MVGCQEIGALSSETMLLQGGMPGNNNPTGTKENLDGQVCSIQEL
jgi:hypothetical protein